MLTAALGSVNTLGSGGPNSRRRSWARGRRGIPREAQAGPRVATTRVGMRDFARIDHDHSLTLCESTQGTVEPPRRTIRSVLDNGDHDMVGHAR
jgi:hypothetical protein